MQLTRPPLAFRLRRAQAISQPLSLHALRGRDGGGGGGREALEQRLVVAEEARLPLHAVERREHPDARTAKEERNEQRRLCPDDPQTLVVEAEPRR